MSLPILGILIDDWNVQLADMTSYGTSLKVYHQKNYKIKYEKYLILLDCQITDLILTYSSLIEQSLKGKFVFTDPNQILEFILIYVCSSK
jgi:hypothetical protein